MQALQLARTAPAVATKPYPPAHYVQVTEGDAKVHVAQPATDEQLIHDVPDAYCQTGHLQAPYAEVPAV